MAYPHGTTDKRKTGEGAMKGWETRRSRNPATRTIVQTAAGPRVMKGPGRERELDKQELVRIHDRAREYQERYRNGGENGCMNSGSEAATVFVLGLIADLIEALE